MSRIKNVKNTTKFKRSIKAISPVIATLLMIAIAVVASLVVYAWVTGYMGNTTSKAGKAIQIQSFASLGGNLVIYVQNVGQGDVELNKDQSIYVNSNLVSITTPATATIPIPVGQTLELQTNSPYTAGTKVTIKVTTTDGTFMTTTGTGTSAGSGGSGTQYTITVTQGTNGVIAPGTSSYDAGSTPSFTITPNSGYHIASITANGASVTVTTPAGQTYQFAALSAAGTLTATYAQNSVTQYTITVTQGTNGVIAPGTSSYDAGSTPSFTITPNSGYHIASITANGASVTVTTPAGQTYQFAALSAAGTLTATYAQNSVTQYTITVTQGTNGVIAPGTSSYDAGSTPSFTITPNSGYHIASITANGASVTVTTPAGQTYQFAALSAAGTLTATYAQNSVTQYTITVTQGTNGVIAPGTSSYDAGSTPSFTITPNSGYHIASITANGASVTVTTPAGQTYQFAALSAAGTLTATYAANILGNNVQGGSSQNIEDSITGSQFTASQTGTAISITAFISSVSSTHNIKGALYSTTGTLLGYTVETSVTTAMDNNWITFNFVTGHIPTLTSGTSYVIVMWANNPSGISSANLAYSSTGGTGRYYDSSYNTNWPTPTFQSDGTRNYSVYVTYSIP